MMAVTSAPEKKTNTTKVRHSLRKCDLIMPSFAKIKHPTVKTLDPFPAFVPLTTNIEHAETGSQTFIQPNTNLEKVN